VLIMLIGPGTSASADLRLRAEVVASRTAVDVDGGVRETVLSVYLRADARYVVSDRGLLQASTPPTKGT
jgi:hypothetical protein